MNSADINVRPPTPIQPRSVEPTRKGAAFGSARGVESLFRNTCRAQTT